MSVVNTPGDVKIKERYINTSMEIFRCKLLSVYFIFVRAHVYTHSWKYT